MQHTVQMLLQHFSVRAPIGRKESGRGDIGGDGENESVYVCVCSMGDRVTEQARRLVRQRP